MSKQLDINPEALEMLNTKALSNEVEVEVSEEDMSDAPMTEEEMMQPDVVNALIAEIQAAAARAKEYKEQSENAQTKTKKDHYWKKLVRNNEEAADMLLALERITQVRKAREDIIDASRDIVQDGSREEPSN